MTGGQHGVVGFDAGPVQAAYAAMAEEYAGRFADDLATDPCRGLLDDALDRMDPRAPVLDLGCGPGTVASVLVAGGRRAVGLDLTMAMLAVAARRLPGLPLVAGDVLAARTRPPRPHEHQVPKLVVVAQAA